MSLLSGKDKTIVYFLRAGGRRPKEINKYQGCRLYAYSVWRPKEINNIRAVVCTPTQFLSRHTVDVNWQGVFNLPALSSPGDPMRLRGIITQDI